MGGEGGAGWEDSVIFVAVATQLHISMQRLAQQIDATPGYFIVELSKLLLGTFG